MRIVPGLVTVPVVLHVDGLCMSKTLGCITFLDLSSVTMRPHTHVGAAPISKSTEKQHCGMADKHKRGGDVRAVGVNQ